MCLFCSQDAFILFYYLSHLSVKHYTGEVVVSIRAFLLIFMKILLSQSPQTAEI